MNPHPHAAAYRPRRFRRPGNPAFALLVAALALSAAARLVRADDEQPKLAIVETVLLDGEDGYPIPADSIFYPGETVYLEFKMSGFRVNDDYRMKTAYRVDFLGPTGIRFALSQAGEISEEIFPQDEDWLPVVRVSPRLPQFAESGAFKIIVTAVDRLAGNEEITFEFPVYVRGESVEPGKTLTIRNLVFSVAKGGAVAEPVYKAGDTVWARFDITGYFLAEDNSFDVESSLEVTEGEGDTEKVLFRFESSGERGRPFYPRRRLPAEFRLDLDDDLAPGEYTVLISVWDKLGDATFESRRTFTVK